MSPADKPINGDPAELIEKGATKPPDGYFLIPKRLAFTLVVLAFYIAIALTVLAVGVWLGLGTDSSQEARLRTLTVQNRLALCGLRSDLHRRVTGTEKLLAMHPEGLPELGVSAAQLLEEVSNQQRTISTLGILDCQLGLSKPAP